MWWTDDIHTAIAIGENDNAYQARIFWFWVCIAGLFAECLLIVGHFTAGWQSISAAEIILIPLCLALLKLFYSHLDLLHSRERLYRQAASDKTLRT